MVKSSGAQIPAPRLCFWSVLDGLRSSARHCLAEVRYDRGFLVNRWVLIPICLGAGQMLGTLPSPLSSYLCLLASHHPSVQHRRFLTFSITFIDDLWKTQAGELCASAGDMWKLGRAGTPARLLQMIQC